MMIDVLKSLIWEIIAERHDLIWHALKHYNDTDRWSFHRLWLVFQDLLNDPQLENVYVIIDALDECDWRYKSDFLSNIAELLTSRDQSAKNSVSLVVSTRPTAIKPSATLEGRTIHCKLDEDAALREHVIEDIGKFVEIELVTDNQLDSDNDHDRLLKLKALASKIANGSGGSFLWATLILEDIRHNYYTSISEIEKFMSACPRSLGDIYYETLAGISTDKRTAVIKSLHIVLAAKAPLSIHDFKTAFAVQAHHRTIESLQDLINGSSIELMKYLRHKVGNIIQIDKSTIKLRHLSAKDFLLNELSQLPTSD